MSRIVFIKSLTRVNETFRALRKIKIEKYEGTHIGLTRAPLDKRPLDINIDLADCLVSDFKEYLLPMSQVPISLFVFASISLCL